jgi:hypothetical protein
MTENSKNQIPKTNLKLKYSRFSTGGLFTVFVVFKAGAL